MLDTSFKFQSNYSTKYYKSINCYKNLVFLPVSYARFIAMMTWVEKQINNTLKKIVLPQFYPNRKKCDSDIKTSSLVNLQTSENMVPSLNYKSRGKLQFKLIGVPNYSTEYVT